MNAVEIYIEIEKLNRFVSFQYDRDTKSISSGFARKITIEVSINEPVSSTFYEIESISELRRLLEMFGQDCQGWDSTIPLIERDLKDTDKLILSVFRSL